MMEVTAAIASERPNRCSQVWAARAIGSKGSSSGFGTGTRYRWTRLFHQGEQD
jgi:hypothetical protein